MAEGGSDSTEIDGNEEFFEWKCKICAEKDIMKEAIAYCKHCDEGFCDICLQFHNRFQRTHRILNQVDKEDWGIPQLTQDTGIECSNHSGHTVSMYCGLHDDVCCPMCIIYSHGDSCKSTVSQIRHISKAIKTRDEFKATVSNVGDLLVCFEELEKDRKKFNRELEGSHDECVKRIESVYSNLEQHLKKLKAVSLGELKKVHKEIDEVAGCDMEKCLKAKQDLQYLYQQLQTPDSENESLLFVKMKQGQKTLTRCKDVSTSLRAQNQHIVTFHENDSLLELIQSAGALGKNVKENKLQPKAGNDYDTRSSGRVMSTGQLAPGDLQFGVHASRCLPGVIKTENSMHTSKQISGRNNTHCPGETPQYWVIKQLGKYFITDLNGNQGRLPQEIKAGPKLNIDGNLIEDEEGKIFEIVKYENNLFHFKVLSEGEVIDDNKDIFRK